MITTEKDFSCQNHSGNLNERKIDGKFIKQFRKHNRLTQLELANILNISKKTVETWEQGRIEIKGCSAILISLLSDNPYLLNQLLYDDTFTKDNYDHTPPTPVTITMRNKEGNELSKTLDFLAEELSFSIGTSKKINVSVKTEE